MAELPRRRRRCVPITCGTIHNHGRPVSFIRTPKTIKLRKRSFPDKVLGYF